MPFFRNKIVWSIVEIEYLKNHRNDDQNQLSLCLSKSRNAIKNKLLEIDGKLAPKTSSKKRTNIGRREDLSLFLRSSWEANFCRYLKSLGISFEYEPKVFTFSGIKHGTMSYLPDIKLSDGTWVEIKGFMDKKSKTQLKRFRQYFPEEFKKLKIVVGSENTAAAKFAVELGIPVFAYYNQLQKKYKNIIPFWE